MVFATFQRSGAEALAFSVPAVVMLKGPSFPIVISCTAEDTCCLVEIALLSLTVTARLIFRAVLGMASQLLFAVVLSSSFPARTVSNFGKYLI